jgi:predicted amidohydrolase
VVINNRLFSYFKINGHFDFCQLLPIAIGTNWELIFFRSSYLMHQPLRITLIQSLLSWENKDANLEMFSNKISRLKEETDLILLPEMFSTGFTMNASAFAEPMDGPSVEWMRRISAEKKCAVAGSLIISEKGKFYNRLIWMKPDGDYFYYDKRHLFRLAHEEQTYTAGQSKLIVELNGWKILPLVCFDLRFPVWSRRTKNADYDVLLYVANWPERRVTAWSQLLIARAIENQCYGVGVNRVGNDGNDIYHSGESAVINYKGEEISGISAHEESIETVALHKDEMEEFRSHLPFLEDADSFTIKL